MRIALSNVRYDAQAAKAERAKRDVEVPAMNRKTTIHNTIVSTLILAVAVLIGYGIPHVLKYPLHDIVTSDLYSMSLMLIYILFGFFIMWIMSVACKPLIDGYDKYTANVRYAHFAEKYNILDIRLTDASFDYHYNTYYINLTLEDTEHKVSTITILSRPVWKEIRTDITTPTLDLQNNKVLVPYKYDED